MKFYNYSLGSFFETPNKFMKLYYIGNVFSPKFNVVEHYIGTATTLMEFVRWVYRWLAVEEACVMGVKIRIVGSDSGEKPCCWCNCSGH